MSDPSIAILTMTFSFVTTIVLLNILIAVMSGAVDSSRLVERLWYKQKAEVIQKTSTLISHFKPVK